MKTPTQPNPIEIMEADSLPPVKPVHSRFFLSGFYCWDWEFLTALLLFSCSI